MEETTDAGAEQAANPSQISSPAAEFAPAHAEAIPMGDPSGRESPTRSAATPDPFIGGASWIGGLLNASQPQKDERSEPQGSTAAIVSAPLLLLIFGIGVGASTSVVGLRRVLRRGEPAPPTVPTRSARPALTVLVERVSRAPMDAAACFQLSLELLKLGVEQDGLRLLDRSIRINPLLIVQLIQEPAHQGVRDSPGVQRMLADVKRDYDRRLLTGYA